MPLLHWHISHSFFFLFLLASWYQHSLCHTELLAPRRFTPFKLSHGLKNLLAANYQPINSSLRNLTESNWKHCLCTVAQMWHADLWLLTSKAPVGLKKCHSGVDTLRETRRQKSEYSIYSGSLPRIIHVLSTLLRALLSALIMRCTRGLLFLLPWKCGR